MHTYVLYVCQMEQKYLMSDKMPPQGVVTQQVRWAASAKGVYIDLWKLGYDKKMKNGGMWLCIACSQNTMSNHHIVNIMFLQMEGFAFRRM
jgi:hypothetical protein